MRVLLTSIFSAVYFPRWKLLFCTLDGLEIIIAQWCINIKWRKGFVRNWFTRLAQRKREIKWLINDIGKLIWCVLRFCTMSWTFLILSSINRADFHIQTFATCTSIKWDFFLKKHVKFGRMKKMFYSKYAPSLVIHFPHLSGNLWISRQ